MTTETARVAVAMVGRVLRTAPQSVVEGYRQLCDTLAEQHPAAQPRSVGAAAAALLRSEFTTARLSDEAELAACEDLVAYLCGWQNASRMDREDDLMLYRLARTLTERR